ncbi:hypothetical protein Goarm_017047 [Gossypium armourianum]|uniref:Uncharacterized protein n=1 Tax=Gossypium armourianum TaxID=34283 RepID=A0A7J9JE33_9ROSI|nr:hypothetical protein [Gossypium armourianum]
MTSTKTSQLYTYAREHIPIERAQRLYFGKTSTDTSFSLPIQQSCRLHLMLVFMAATIPFCF